MLTVYILLFFSIHFIHCCMARNFLTYYMAKPYPFHLNLIRWNQDVQLVLDSLV